MDIGLLWARTLEVIKVISRLIVAHCAKCILCLFEFIEKHGRAADFSKNTFPVEPESCSVLY